MLAQQFDQLVVEAAFGPQFVQVGHDRFCLPGGPVGRSWDRAWKMSATAIRRPASDVPGVELAWQPVPIRSVACWPTRLRQRQVGKDLLQDAPGVVAVTHDGTFPDDLGRAFVDDLFGDTACFDTVQQRGD